MSQRLPTDGAHAAEFFEIRSEVDEHEVEEQESSLWLAIANFGDRPGNDAECINCVAFGPSPYESLSACRQCAYGRQTGSFRLMDRTGQPLLGSVERGRRAAWYRSDSHVYRIMAGDSSSGNTVDETRGDL